MNYKNIFSNKIIRIDILAKYSLLMVLLVITSCATNPVSGIPDFVTITEQQEISIGASYHKQILEENKVIKNKELNEFYIKLNLTCSKMYISNNKIYLLGGKNIGDYDITPSSALYSIDIAEFNKTQIRRTKTL